MLAYHCRFVQASVIILFWKKQNQNPNLLDSVLEVILVDFQMQTLLNDAVFCSY